MKNYLQNKIDMSRAVDQPKSSFGPNSPSALTRINPVSQQVSPFMKSSSYGQLHLNHQVPLKSVKSSGLPQNSFTSKIKSPSRVTTFVTLGAPAESDPMVINHASQDLRDYIKSQEKNKPFDQKYSIQSNDEPVFRMFKAKSSSKHIKEIQLSPPIKEQVKLPFYVKRPIDFISSTESTQLKLASFNPQQFQELLKSEVAVQTSVIDSELPQPESCVPLPSQASEKYRHKPHINIEEPNQSIISNPSYSNIKVSVLIHRDEEEYVMEGNTKDKQKLLNDLQDLFNQYTRKSVTNQNLSPSYRSASKNRQVGKYIKMSNLEESLFHTQKHSQRGYDTFNTQEASSLSICQKPKLSEIPSNSKLKSSCVYSQDIKDLLRSSERENLKSSVLQRKKNSKINPLTQKNSAQKARSPFLKKSNHKVTPQVSEFKTLTKSQKKPQKSNENSVFDERTFKF